MKYVRNTIITADSLPTSAHRARPEECARLELLFDLHAHDARRRTRRLGSLQGVGRLLHFFYGSGLGPGGFRSDAASVRAPAGS